MCCVFQLVWWLKYEQLQEKAGSATVAGIYNLQSAIGCRKTQLSFLHAPKGVRALFWPILGRGDKSRRLLEFVRDE